MCKWSIATFVVTLAMFMSYKGLAKVITKAYPITPFPDSFSFWGRVHRQDHPRAHGADAGHRRASSTSSARERSLGGRSTAWAGTRRRRASPASRSAARASGVCPQRVDRGLGGVIISTRIMAGAYNVGEGLEFEVIAAVVIGGTSLQAAPAR